MYVVEEFSNVRHVEDVIFLGKLHHAEVRSQLPYEPDAIRDTAKRLMADYDRGHYNVWLVYAERGTDKEPVGYVIGVCNRYFFTFSYCAHQELWYVRPEHRGTKAVTALLRAYEEWARVRGARQIFTGIVAEDMNRVQRFASMMGKIGYRYVGQYFVKETAGGNRS